MTWAEAIAALRENRFLLPLGGLTARELADRMKWIFFLRTDALRAWAERDGWLPRAVRHNDPTAHPLLATLLERYVLDLDTRADPTLLLSFWARVAEAATAKPDVLGVWTAYLPALAATAPAMPPDLADIGIQEQKFVAILADVARAVEAGSPALGWAADALGRVAARRVRPADRTDRATVRVVFAWGWKGNAPPEARTAFLAEFELKDQLGARPGALAGPVRLFDSNFLAAARRAAEAVGSRNFHRLELACDGEGHAGLLTADKRLEGTSGGLAVTAAQLLANRRNGNQWAVHTLPPWLVLSATLDAAGRLIVPVDALADKITLLREEGVRAVGVAEQQRDEAKALAGRLLVVTCQALPSTVATTLLDLGATWPANLTRYKAWHGLTWRQARILGAFVGCVLLVFAVREIVNLSEIARLEKEKRETAQATRATATNVAVEFADVLVKVSTVDKFQAAVPDGQRALDLARSQLAKLAADIGDDPERTGKIAELHRYCGKLAFNLGDLKQAAIDYDNALRLADRAVGADDTPANRLLLAKVLRERGVMPAMQGKVDQSLQDWERAGVLLRSLAPTDPDAQFTLARLHMVKGNVGKTPQAQRAEFDQAETLIDGLLKAAPANREYRFTLAEILNNKMYFLGDKVEENIAVCSQAVEIRRKLAEEQPNSQEQRAYLAASLNHLGNALSKLRPRPYDKAKAAYDEAIQIYRGLIDAFPGVKSNKEELLEVEHNLNDLKMKQPE